MYIRKTIDMWIVQGNYGEGWEDVTSSENYKEARQDLKDYRENDKIYSYRLILKRVKKGVL